MLSVLPSRGLVTAAVITSVLICPSLAASRRVVPANSDRDYICALAAANAFLHAWQAHDRETGLLMLTDRAKARITEDNVRAFFSSEPGALQAFLISTGKKVKPGRYSFRIALLKGISGNETVHRNFSRLIIVRAAKDDWAVDNVP